MVMTAMMAAVICVLGPLAIPIGPVPIAITNLAIYLSGYMLGWKRATLSCVVYVLIGMVGMPVFSGYSGGLGKLAGPTGGYIIGYIFMALVSGLVVSRFEQRGIQLLGMAAGTVTCYVLGTAWFCVQAGYAVGAALSLCVFPFIPGDIAKMVVALYAGPKMRTRLIQANLYRP